MSWTDDTDPSHRLPEFEQHEPDEDDVEPAPEGPIPRPPVPSEPKPWSGLSRVRFCPVCGGENVDTSDQGGNRNCVCRDCETLFTIVALAVTPTEGGGAGGGILEE